MRPVLEYFPVEICKTVECGNKAEPETGFCEDCVPIAEPGLVLSIVLMPLRLLGRLLGV